MREAAWPQIRDDLSLSYTEVGILLGLPLIVANLIEIPIAFLGDTGLRKRLVVIGGAFFALAVLGMAVAPSFWILLGAFVMFSPASGAFVSLAQASLVDVDPARGEQNMARWTFAGSAGILAGTVAIGLAASVGMSWRAGFLLASVVAVLGVVGAARAPIHAPQSTEARSGMVSTLVEGVVWAIRSVRRGDVLRWLILLEVSDLVGDILLGYLALYLVDVGGASSAEAAFGVVV
ncbi:MAG TPA: MFS transporter, partial [Chloroflexota bacterium]